MLKLIGKVHIFFENRTGDLVWNKYWRSRDESV